MADGYLGGTFDPIHVGHLDVANAARQALGLERVWFVPARIPPHRATPLASAAHRFAMTALAVAGAPGLFLSDLEQQDDDPSYTSATLDRLADRGVDTRTLFLITGADAFSDIRAWKDFPAILDRAHFVVVSRPGAPVEAVRRALPDLAPRFRETPCSIPSQPGIFLVDAQTAPVSSTTIRRAAAAGESLAGLVPAAVAEYIERQGLYRR